MPQQKIPRSLQLSELSLVFEYSSQYTESLNYRVLNSSKSRSVTGKKDIEILGGLQTGEMIVVTGIVQLQEGMQVTLLN